MLNLKKNRKRWTSKEKTYLKENAGLQSDKDIAHTLGKTIKSIREMRYRMNIKKKCGRGIIELDERLV